MNRINDLIQKQINANAEAQDVTVEEILNPIITLPSKVVMRDNLFKSNLRSITEGQIAYFPIDPDLQLMRLWILNEHGGRNLTDHSFMQNTIQLNGTDQTKLVWANDDDGISGSPIVNRLIDDQYIRVEDNANVQIKNIAATAQGISIFLRLWIEYARSENKFQKPNVLFSKIDSEQVDYAYAGYLYDDGAIAFFVRDNRREYSVVAPSQSIIWTNINLPDYSETDYTTADYYTIGNIQPLPDPTPYVDLCFTYEFATHKLQIIRSDFTDGPGIIIASSSTAVNGVDGPLTSNLKGWWKMTEGGPVGTTPVNTINDLSTNVLNATAVNPLWDPSTSNIIFLGNNGYVPIVTNTSGKQINNLTTAVTFAAWARIDSTQGGYAGLVSNINGRSDGNKILVRNVGADSEVLWRGHNGTNPVDTLGVLANANLVGDGLWHHYAVVYDAATVKIFVDGQLIFSEPQSYTLASGTSNMTIGWGSTNTTLYHLTGSMQDVLLYNTNLTDEQILEIYEQGQRISYFPKWRADPPTEPPPPSPTSNPFVNVYNVALPAVAERDMVRLHQITATSLQQRYSVGQGAQEDSQPVTEDVMYDNFPDYDSGTAVQEVPSIYAKTSTSSSAALKLNSATFSGEKFVSGTGDDIIGKPITKVIAKLADINPNNTPATGLITCRIVRPDGQSQTTASNSYEANDLPDNQNGTNTTNWATVAFTFPGNNYATPTNTKIQFEFDKGGVPPEAITQYNQLATAVTHFSAIEGDQFAGQVFQTGIDVVGTVITKVDVKLCDLNPTTAAATGPIVAKIVTAAHAEVAVSNTIEASSVTDNVSGSDPSKFSTHTFTFAGNTRQMATGDRIQFEYDEGGTAGAPGPPGPESLSTYQRLNGNRDSGGNIHSTEYLAQVIDSTSCPFYNKAISRLVVAMFRNTSSATQNIWAEVRTSAGTLKETSNTVSATTMPLFYPQPYGIHLDFSNPTYAMQVGDYIAIKYNFGGSSGAGSCGCFLESSGGPGGTHVYDNSNGTIDHAGNAYDISMDVYIRTPGAPGAFKSVGVALTSTNPETATNAYGALYATPTNLSQFTTYDTCMDVYGGSIAKAKTVGVAYGTNLIAPHNAYDGTYGGSVVDRSTFDLALDVFIDKKTGQPNHQYTQLQNAGNKFVGEFINATASKLFGQKLTKITARIYKVGSPTGNLFCRIRKGAGGSDITFGLNGSTTTPGLDVSTLTGANNPATVYTFQNDANKDEETGYALAQGDRIIFELSGGISSASAYVMIAKTTGSSAVPDVHLQTSTAGSTWTTADSQTADHIGRMWIGGGFTQTKYPFHNLGYENTRVTQKVTSNNTTDPGSMYNQKITQVKAWLMRVGSPTGQINCVIRKALPDDSAISINVYNASDISNTDFQLIPFMNLNNSYPMAVGDRVSLEYTGGNLNNHIRVNTNLLSTYPYGNLEVYTAGNYVTKISHDLAGTMSIGGGATDPLARTRVAERVATTNSLLKFKKISRVRVWLRKQSNPLGTVVIRIRNSANQERAVIGSVNAETQITSDPTEYTVTSSPISVYPLQVGDYVSVEYNGGDDANFVEVMTTKTVDAFDGVVNTYVAKWDDFNWANNTAIDLVGRMDEGGDTYTPSQEDVIIPPPLYTKDLTVLAGGPPWTYIDHTSSSTLTHAPSQLFTNAVMPDFRFYRKVLTITELINIFTNRIDRADIAYGEVARVGFFAVSEE
jgi:hypothetical protein